MTYNPYIVVPFATWAVAQIAKFAIAAFRGKIDFRYLYASGGMPSVHSAIVCSLATTALLIDGFESHIFGFAAIFAAIVMYDSFGVRRSAGEQAAAINMLIGSLGRDRIKLLQPNLHLREILGHQPREVAVGALLGIALACLFNYDRLGAFGSFLQAAPSRPEMLAYAIIFGLLIIGGAITKLVLRMRYRKSKIMARFSGKILAATQTVGWLGVVTVVLAFEHASYFSWRLWSDLILAMGLVWGTLLIIGSYRIVPETLATEVKEARKLKWLRWGRDKKSKRN